MPLRELKIKKQTIAAQGSALTIREEINARTDCRIFNMVCCTVTIYTEL